MVTNQLPEPERPSESNRSEDEIINELIEQRKRQMEALQKIMTSIDEHDVAPVGLSGTSKKRLTTVLKEKIKKGNPKK